MGTRRTAIIKGATTGWFTNIDPTLVREKYQGGVHYIDESWADVKNVQIDPYGTVIKRRGGQNKHSTPLGDPTPITLIYQYWKSDGSNFLLAYAHQGASTHADVYEYSGAASGFTSVGGSAVSAWAGDIDDRPFATVFQDTFFLTNGADTPVYWQGTGSIFKEMPSAAGKGKYMIPFRNYLIFANVQDPETADWHPGRIKWGAVGAFANNSDWPITYTLDLDPDDGDIITGVGVVGDTLIVFKEKKIYMIYYVGPPWFFDYKVISNEQGCQSGTSIVTIHGELIFASGDGIYSLKGTKVTDLTEKIRDKYKNMDPDFMKYISGALLEERNQIWFTVPYAGEDKIASEDPNEFRPTNEVWVYDRVLGYWTRYDIQMACLSVWDDITDLKIGDLKQPFDSYDWAWDARFGGAATNQIIGGDYRGFVNDLNYGSQDASSYKSASTTDIDAWVKTQWLDYGYPTDTKRIYRTIFMITPQGSTAYDLTVTYRYDWNDESDGETKTLSLVGSAYDVMKEKRIDYTRQFRAMQLQYGTSLANQPFAVHQIGIDYQRKGKTGLPTYG